MVTLKGLAPVALAAALTAALISSCTNGSFTGENKKIEKTETAKKKPESKPAEKPTSKPQSDDSGQQPDTKPTENSTVDTDHTENNTDNEIVTANDVGNDVVVPGNNTDIVAIPTTTTPPVVESNTNVPSTPPMTSNPETNEAVASMQVPVTCFVNMEHGYHGTDENYIVQLKDGSGSVVAAGYSTPDAVRNGTPTDGRGAYPGMMLDFDLTWLKDPRLTSGSGTLSVCYSNPGLTPEKGVCEAKQSTGIPADGERPTAITNAPAQWSVADSGGKPQIKVSGNYNLSTHHPVWGLAKAGGCFKDYQSPLVLDMNGNGRFDLVDVWNDKTQIRFDINADGEKIRTGWVEAGDAMLAIDLNHNGLIDDGGELFGEYTKGSRVANKGERSFDNGFQALAEYDSNMDGRINKNDKMFASLLLWTDLNQDGISQKKELSVLGFSKVAEISLAYAKLGNLAPAIVANNEVRLQSSFKLENGRERLISDVWFKQRRYSDKVAVQ